MEDTAQAPRKEVYLFDPFRQPPRRLRLFASVVCATLLVLGSVSYSFWWKAPSGFPAGTLLILSPGTTLGQASELLLQRKLIRSPWWFKAVSVLLGGERGLKAGKYYLERPLSVFGMSFLLVKGNYNQSPLRITIPEGTNVREVADILEDTLLFFDRAHFLSLVRGKEGYLFPDTYFFAPASTEEEIVETMEKTFNAKARTLKERVEHFGKSLREVVIMASLLEEEARTTETRRTIAGILWKRLEKGMPLQVDAVFPYIIGKNTFELTTDNLKIDSPYNTYLHLGLPPGPITNPGLDAILAAVTPIQTRYFYYLSDKAGNMHYAVTHEEHLVNRAKYLNK